MLHQPKNVDVARRGHVQAAKLADGRCRAPILPAVNLGMAVRERHAAGLAVVTAGIVDHDPGCPLVRPAVHAGAPFAVVDAVASLIQEYDRH